MKVYTYSEARQQLASLLDRARQDGVVRIRRRDGSAFLVQPDVSRRSPLDVPAARLDLGRDEIVRLVREGRERAPVPGWAPVEGTGASLARDAALPSASKAARSKARAAGGRRRRDRK
jgi:hypothetical protein